MAGWSDEVTLIETEAPQDASGYSEEQEIGRRGVFGSIESVTRAEFYLADQSGKRADIVVEIYKEEYNGETLLELATGKYKVIRTFTSTKKPDMIELVCTDLSRPPAT